MQTSSDPLVHTEDGVEYRSYRNTEDDNRDTAAWLREKAAANSDPVGAARAARVADLLDTVAAEQAARA